ncbi:MAG: hypothetical protein K2O30_07130 [Duncaniella sp.]|nr:hypothetical protein [Duncaniella sp.]MDE7145905.1 hypothetical protein [Duncaniella sp.]
MEKIKVDVYVKGQLVSLGGITASNIIANIHLDDQRYDFSEAIVLDSGMLTGPIAVPEGKVVVVEKDITSTTHRCSSEQFEGLLADALSARHLWGLEFNGTQYFPLTDNTKTGVIARPDVAQTHSAESPNI